ncbi:restriction endonuclease subunit S [Psychrobacter sp. DAB_AL43B]|uniref:restriction endonuclease subunit S n=1 Tax=Psychrobacter sp. DAB_AL43B TaxID=1028416 RepID=UPI0009A7C6BE|nr:restriction endonuclease subunit S [Psychrobacter sp. DAB_AL43B]SLJ85207.1 type I restriction enzyme, S subunit [Psychrobacter sp. DAB_AL43B]
MINEESKKNYPTSWEIVKLGDFADSEKGKKPKNQQPLQNEEFHLPYIDIEAFEKGIFKSFTDGEKCIICDDSDFLMVWDGSRSGLVGKGLKGALGSTLVRINLPMINNLYGYYYLQSKYLEINTRAKGVGIPHVDSFLLWSYDFPIPPVNEQNRIVDKIEALFSEVDAGIANLTLAKRQLTQYRQSLLKHAFEGKLTARWREDYAEKHGKSLPSADELLEQIQTARQDYYDQKITDWEQAVEAWEEQDKEGAKPRKPSAFIKPEKNSSVNNYLIDYFYKKVNFSELYDVFIGSTPSRSISEYWNGDINWISSGEVTFSNIRSTKEKITQLGLAKTSTSVHPIGTVMLAMIGEGKTRGQASILKIEACHNQNTAALRVNNDLLSSEYLYFYLLYSYEMTRRIGSGNNQKALNKTVIQNMTIPICSFEEQTEIAQILERQNNAIESSKQTLDKYLKKATLLKTSILHKAFQGKLVPQDPNNPPASELLAQIKAEREAKALAEKQSKQDKTASKSKAKTKSAKTPNKSKKDEQITLSL